MQLGEKNHIWSGKQDTRVNQLALEFGLDYDIYHVLHYGIDLDVDCVIGLEAGTGFEVSYGQCCHQREGGSL
jgi:hypothetical protein